MTKETLERVPKEANLFHKDVSAPEVLVAGRPPLLVPGGLSAERIVHLFKSVKEYFHKDFRDEMWPDPAA